MYKFGLFMTNHHIYIWSTEHFLYSTFEFHLNAVYETIFCYTAFIQIIISVEGAICSFVHNIYPIFLTRYTIKKKYTRHNIHSYNSGHLFCSLTMNYMCNGLCLFSCHFSTVYFIVGTVICSFPLLYFLLFLF